MDVLIAMGTTIAYVYSVSYHSNHVVNLILMVQ